MIGVDLGSNTFRVVEIECKSLRATGRFERIVRTADGLASSGRISEAAVERIIAAAREAAERFDFSRQRVRAVTTEALRKASNGREVLARIREETGLEFAVIDGKEEAALTLLAVKERLKSLGLPSESFVMVDIGGGSTEVVLHTKETTRVQSFGVGIVTLAQQYGDPDAIEAALEEKMAPIARFWQDAGRQGAYDLFVATAGTPTTVAAMTKGMTYDTYDPDRINGTRLLRATLAQELARLLAMTPEERRRMVGVGRDDLIAAGILIFRRLYDIFGFEEAVVIDDGLREGVAIAECLGLKADEIIG